MARQAQFQFTALKDYTRTIHGGDIGKGKRKLIRPIATKRPMHLVMRASRARGPWSMHTRANSNKVQSIVFGSGRRFDVEIHRFANAGNHLHLIIQAKTRAAFKAYLRTITGLIARAVTGAKKGHAKGKFWDALAFSRIVSWGRDFSRATAYVLQNALEAFGIATKRKAGTEIVWNLDG